MDLKAISGVLANLKSIVLADETPVEDNPVQEIKTESGDVLYSDNLEVGGELMDADKKVIESGEYKLEDGRTIVVEDSKISEIKEAEEVTEEVVEAAEDDEVVAEEPVQEPQPSKESVLNAIAEMLGVDLSVDGWYSVEFSTSDGVINWGELMTNSYKTLMSEQEAKATKDLEGKDAELKELKAKLSTQATQLSEAGKLIEALEKGVKEVEDFKEHKPVNLKKEVKQVKLSRAALNSAVLTAQRNK